jgi:hypothetical protein
MISRPSLQCECRSGTARRYSLTGSGDATLSSKLRCSSACRDGAAAARSNSITNGRCHLQNLQRVSHRLRSIDAILLIVSCHEQTVSHRVTARMCGQISKPTNDSWDQINESSID